MNISLLIFFILTLLCVAAEAFFSMFEMAAVSFNKVRLQYYASNDKRGAIWLKYLLSKPSRLFGTTLIAVNMAMQLGSECSRQLYETINLSPNFAPITQVLMVITFGELAPLFAARRYPEQVALFSVQIVYFLSKLFSPFIWVIEAISKSINFIFKNPMQTNLFLSREEIQRAFEERGKKRGGRLEDINKMVGSIFSLKDKKAKHLMIPLNFVRLFSQDTNTEEVINSLKLNFIPFILIYHGSKRNITGIVYAKDLLKVPKGVRITTCAKDAWFLAENVSILKVLQHFKQSGEKVVVVLGESGLTVGILTLNQLIDEIFEISTPSLQKVIYPKQILVEKMFPGDMLLSEFNKRFNIHLECEKAKTLSDLIVATLDHHPVKGEVIYCNQLEMKVIESSLLGVKTLSIKTAN